MINEFIIDHLVQVYIAIVSGIGTGLIANHISSNKHKAKLIIRFILISFLLMFFYVFYLNYSHKSLPKPLPPEPLSKCGPYNGPRCTISLLGVSQEPGRHIQATVTIKNNSDEPLLLAFKRGLSPGMMDHDSGNSLSFQGSKPQMKPLTERRALEKNPADYTSIDPGQQKDIGLSFARLPPGVKLGKRISVSMDFVSLRGKEPESFAASPCREF